MPQPGSAKLTYGHGLELHKLGSSNLKYLNKLHFGLHYPDLVAPEFHFSSKNKLTCRYPPGSIIKHKYLQKRVNSACKSTL
jgi:hypothetical protein